MNKRDVKVIRRNAAQLPTCYYIATLRFPDTVTIPNTDGDFPKVEKIMNSKPIAVRVNHARRLRHAFQENGHAGMSRYLDKVSKAVHQGGHIMERHRASYQGLTLSKVSAATA